MTSCKPGEWPSCWADWQRSGICGVVVVVILTALAASGSSQQAHAQYRAGAFIDGRPVFGRRRSSAEIMRLRGRRAAKRYQRRPRVRRRGREVPVKVVFPSVISPDARVPAFGAARPPLPTPNAKSLPSSVQRVTKRRQRRATKRKKVLQIVVSLGRQRMTVYQDGRTIGRSSISSGKAGHRTPTGVFSIIQKRRHHRSNIYSNAPMPFMQRITWSGIALHEGRLPGYAASHGCVRLPRRFARKLFKTTSMRTHVVIARGNPSPRAFSHPNLPGAANLGDVQLAKLITPSNWFRERIRRRLGRMRHRSTQLPVHLASSGAGALPARGPVLRAYDRDVFRLAAMLHFDQSEMIAHRHRVARTRTAEPLRVLVTRRTQRDQIRDVQRRLAVLGYNVGALDGQLGRQTIGLIKHFQRANKLRASGYPDAATRDLLAVRSELPQPSRVTVYVRQGGRQIYSGPIKMVRPDAPIGTHLYTLTDLDNEADTVGAWTAITLQAKGRLPSWSKRVWQQRLPDIEAVDAHDAIGRIIFPAHVRAAIEDRLTPGSSLIIADRGSERETGLATDFVVLTD
ncbi:MAG: L,D-transpeptidase family protein [Hyphomicrobiaceae bacterium]